MRKSLFAVAVILILLLAPHASASVSPADLSIEVEPGQIATTSIVYTNPDNFKRTVKVEFIVGLAGIFTPLNPTQTVGAGDSAAFNFLVAGTTGAHTGVIAFKDGDTVLDIVSVAITIPEENDEPPAPPVGTRSIRATYETYVEVGSEQEFLVQNAATNEAVINATLTVTHPDNLMITVASGYVTLPIEKSGYYTGSITASGYLDYYFIFVARGEEETTSPTTGEVFSIGVTPSPPRRTQALTVTAWDADGNIVDNVKLWIELEPYTNPAGLTCPDKDIIKVHATAGGETVYGPVSFSTEEPPEPTPIPQDGGTPLGTYGGIIALVVIMGVGFHYRDKIKEKWFKKDM